MCRLCIEHPAVLGVRIILLVARCLRHSTFHSVRIILLLVAIRLRHFAFHRAHQGMHWHRTLHLTWVSDNLERAAGCWQHRCVPSPSVLPRLRRIPLPGRPAGLSGGHPLPTRCGHSNSWPRKWLPLLRQRCTAKEDSAALSLGPRLQTFM